jgi:hypothetical protein
VSENREADRERQGQEPSSGGEDTMPNPGLLPGAGAEGRPEACPSCATALTLDPFPAADGPWYDCPGCHGVFARRHLNTARATRAAEREEIEASLRWVMARIEMRPRNDGKQAWCRFCPGFWPMGGQEAHDKDCGYARARDLLAGRE